MRFADPKMLVWLWVLIPIIFFFWLMVNRKRKILEKFAQPQLIPVLLTNFHLKKYYLKVILLAAAFFLSITALARPQWGFEWQEVKRRGVDIVVAIDTSKSMLTQDVKPNRLERAKLGVKDLVRKLQGDRISLIAFAGDAFMVCPLTSDYNGFLITLDDINTDTVPRGGTAVAQAIEEAIKHLENTPSPYRSLIILTDGENLEGDPLKAAEEAKKKGVKIFCIGLGTQEGELIQFDEKGQKEFLKDEQGNFIKSRLNEDLLQKIASITGGAYIRASGAQIGLDLIYDRELSKMERRDIENKKEKKYFERFQIPLSIAILLLLLESAITLYSRKKSFSALIIAGFLFSCSGDVFAAPVFKDIHDGNVQYGEREYEKALEKYNRAYEKDPNSDIINFNMGTSLYRVKKYPEALEHFQKSLLTDNDDLKAKSYFNLGDVNYRLAMGEEDRDIDKATSLLEKAIEENDKSLKINPDDKDAQHNRDFFQAELRRLKRNKSDPQRKQNQQKQQQQQDNKNQQNQEQSSQSENSEQEKSQDQPAQKGQVKEQAGSDQAQQKQSGEEDAEEKKEKLKVDEANKLLEQYQNNEEPDGMLYLERGGQPREKPVGKDW